MSPPAPARTVSAPFIINERYGTRCSTVLLVERNGRTVLLERRFDATGVQTGTSRFEFRSADIPEVWFEAEDPDEEVVNGNSFCSGMCLTPALALGRRLGLELPAPTALGSTSAGTD